MTKPQRSLKQSALTQFQAETPDYALSFYRQLKSYILQIQSQVLTLPFFVQAPLWQDASQRDLRQELSYWSAHLELMDQALHFLTLLYPDQDLDRLCDALREHLKQLYQAQALSFEVLILQAKLETQAIALKQLRLDLLQAPNAEGLQAAYLACDQLADELDRLERQGVSLQGLETLYIDLIIELGDIQTEANQTLLAVA